MKQYFKQIAVCFNLQAAVLGLHFMHSNVNVSSRDRSLLEAVTNESVARNCRGCVV